ncbi:MAG: tRNA (adenine(58)-N(1))-methyltransferase non-catalytic subunit trm6 [Chrysothrix sp. TS-e1954]|nr:MAG: tRNA (adenine(58)-N(1))-methyltransferase non-catalytic subunit trm6 [Chrysothrix sp. TS-e1954]
MSPTVRPHTYVALRLPSDTHKVIKVIPDTAISIGKFGTFPANLILGRPFYWTFEIQDKRDDEAYSGLRLVSAQELYAETASEDTFAASESRDETDAETNDGAQIDVVDEKGNFIIKSNKLTIDDASRQMLSMQEIEELKNATASGSGRETIAKIMKSHSALNEKTEFSLAKYTLRKTKKYLKRFTVLPLDVNLLAKWMIEEKDPSRIMELREETLGLVASWANVHFAEPDATEHGLSERHREGGGRWLIVDDTGGLVVALMAERLGILEPRLPQEATKHAIAPKNHADDNEAEEVDNTSFLIDDNQLQPNGLTVSPHTVNSSSKKQQAQAAEEASTFNNTLTLLHSAGQANLSLLTYFNYDPYTQSSSMYPAHSHPLHAHLKTLSWLQLVSPELDPVYTSVPSPMHESELAALKSSKRGAYFRKRRRWERTHRVVDETRAGGFDGLIIASAMDPTSVLHHTVPLLRGGAQVVVYSSNIEPLTKLADAYSTERKIGYLTALGYTDQSDSNEQQHPPTIPSEDFPLNPRLLLAPTLQTARAVPWQVLPGRTHPRMMSRGGAEGYLFTATRVLPLEGKISARGRFAKKRRVDDIAAP